MAVTIRPDMAFAVSRLASFLINPGPLYHKVANEVINYLASIKDLALYFGGFNNLETVNNTLFANNTFVEIWCLTLYLFRRLRELTLIVPCYFGHSSVNLGYKIAL